MISQRRIAVVTDDAAALPPEWVRPSGDAAAVPPAAPPSAPPEGDGRAAGVSVSRSVSVPGDPSDDDTASDDGAASDDHASTVARATRPGLALAAMPVTVDGEALTGPEEDWLGEVETALSQGRPAATSRPSPGQLLRQFRLLEAQGFEGIVSIHCSAELSGSATSARIASAALGIPVEIVDTRTIAMAEGAGVMAAWDAAGEGADMAGVAEIARQRSAASQLLLWVPGLDTLRQGGRIGPSTAALGTMLQVKPILRISQGQLTIAELPMTEQRARTRLIRRAARALRECPQEHPELTVHHLLGDRGRQQAEDLAEEIVAEHCPEAVARCLPMPAVLAAHAGPGALAVVVHG